MQIIVTGGSGYLGTHVCHRLNADSASRRDGIDIGKPGNLGCLTRYDAIVHMAAHMDKKPEAADRCFAVNVQGTLNILKKMRYDQTLIYASTKDVYGSHTLRRRIVNEKCPTTYINQGAYEWSKLIAEKYVEYFSRRINIRTVILRLSTTYAPLTDGNSGTFINFFADAIKKGIPITLKSRGRQVRDLLHVDDLTDIIKRCIQSNVSGEIFNVGGGPDNTITLTGLVDVLAGMIGKKPVLKLSSDKETGQMRYVSDIQKIGITLGWKPRISIKQGLKTIL